MFNQDTQEKAIAAILDPSCSTNVDELLDELNLNGLPDKKKVYKEIEEKVLLPRTRLPDHWLPAYQM